MGIKAVLFDLDGTLLPMDLDEFVEKYLASLAKKMVNYGYAPKEIVGAIWKGTSAMIENDGKATNEVVFWNEFAKIFGENSRKDEPLFDEFYRNEFADIKEICGYNENAAAIVRSLKNSGIPVVLATSPIFPEVATKSRMNWAGLDTEDFDFYTTYENCRYTKPNVKYYEDVAEKLGLKPEECLMVGNDVGDDMVAANIGMKVFLLTDYLINKNEVDISNYPNGGYQELIKFLKIENLI